MRNFKDLKTGDIIYYWNKCKLHKQVVHKIEIKLKQRSYSFPNGDYFTKDYEELIIQAGNSREYSINEWYINDSFCGYGGMPRFSDYTRAKQWIENLKRHKLMIIDKFEKKINQQKKLLNKFEYEY
jgi:hypothetical protein